VHGAKKAKLLYGVAAGVISAGSPVLEKQHFEKKNNPVQRGKGVQREAPAAAPQPHGCRV